MSSSDGVPVLWHLKPSHYNEKVRWALDYKAVQHIRRGVDPGTHPAVAKRLTGGRTDTFPVLELGGRAIGDSTLIIETLERRHPEPALYPADPARRRRALELEDFFDEELGPYVRLLVFHHALGDPGLFLEIFAPDLAPELRTATLENFDGVKQGVNARFEIDDRSVDHARQKIRAAGERFQVDLQPGGYLSEEGFSVADLTLAAIVAPAVAPPEFPYPQPQRDHELFESPRAIIAEAGILDWSKEIYARHRGRSTEIEEPQPAGTA